MAARELQQEHYNVVSVIGDGSMTGGMAYEALNNASRLKSNLLLYSMIIICPFPRMWVVCQIT